MFEAVRRRLETGGSTELQEGFLGRWVESARDKVHHLKHMKFFKPEFFETYEILKPSSLQQPQQETTLQNLQGSVVLQGSVDLSLRQHQKQISTSLSSAVHQQQLFNCIRAARRHN